MQGLSIPSCQPSTGPFYAGNSAPPPRVTDTARLFLALLPAGEATTALAHHRDQWRWQAGAVCYAPQDWHTTLHFIGSVACPRLHELLSALAVPMRPFRLRFGQASLWPHGVAVVCPEKVPHELRQLHARLGVALQAAGLPTESRPLRPHVTLARHAQASTPPRQCPPFEWPVAGYSLLASTGLKAPRYRELQHYGQRDEP